MPRPVNKYFISEYIEEDPLNGGIGNTDIEKILISNDFTAIRLPYHYDSSFRAKVGRFFYVLKLLINLPRKSIIFFQTPLFARMNYFLLKILLLRRSISMICFVADINGIKYNDRRIFKKDIRFLNRYRYFILHNQKMKQWLDTIVPGNKSSSISFFDFLAKPAEHTRELTTTVAFAGNLEKSGFLENMDKLLPENPSVIFNVYGEPVTDRLLSCVNIRYKGVYKPYEMPSVIEGSFGLIWDGNSIDGPDAGMGNYMRYISHHKLSLYILAKLPVIVYEDAGSAELVKRFNIGFTVRSLFEIQDKINKLSIDEYNQMVNNTRPLALKISKGRGLIDAVDEILEQMV